ncbi:outer membrane protein assembly factor BamB family protein [Streptomyces erythrochromogenes]|uniref:outer membrane protein assembly factor BamB family protein n=1 Tax=Streptomyces erythrochromogenes TaxID=285574 RepID=UPI0036846E25
MARVIPVPTLRRVFGGGPFAEVGEPSVAVADDRSGLVAVGGDLGSLQWSGSGTAAAGWSGHRIGVYEPDGLRCRHLLRSSMPVRSLAFHPVLPLLAVGSGSYDGGHCFEGELLLVHLDTGEVVSALQHQREVLDLAWLSWTELRVVLAPPDDWVDPEAWQQGHTAVVTRADWGAVGTRGVRAEEVDAPVAPYARPDRAPRARRLLADLAGAVGLDRSVRRRVWAVAGLPDGRALAALDGVLVECWLPSGQRQWAVGDEQGGRQLLPAADGVSLWTNAGRRVRRTRTGWETSDPQVARVALDTGRVLGTVSAGEYAVLVAGGGKRLVLRPVEDSGGAERRLLMFEPDGTATKGPEVRGFDLFNHAFPMRRSSRPYVLVGTDPQWAHRGMWVAAVDADGTLRPLFPHSWVPQEHHVGGPAVEIGESLVYAGSVHEPQGPSPGSSYVVRRSLDGEVLWEHRSDHRATALDSDGGTVCVADNSGALTALDAATGAVLWRTALTVGGVPACALSLAVAPPGRLLLGTVDGRVLEYG